MVHTPYDKGSLHWKRLTAEKGMFFLFLPSHWLYCCCHLTHSKKNSKIISEMGTVSTKTLYNFSLNF